MKKRKSDYILPIERDSPEWDQYYLKRSAAERIFSRLKLELGLLQVKRRTIQRVTFHFAMCLIAMLVVTLVSIVRNQPELCLSVEAWRY